MYQVCLIPQLFTGFRTRCGLRAFLVAMAHNMSPAQVFVLLSDMFMLPMVMSLRMNIHRLPLSRRFLLERNKM
jgi:hypothetical protein